MKQSDVYQKMNLTPLYGNGSNVTCEQGVFLDFYGGHGVISVGHCHPEYVNAVTNQLKKLVFYSNAVHCNWQQTLANKLGQISGYADFNVFLCNSGTEANENALKVASFCSGKKRFIAFKNSFHGRTAGSAALSNFSLQSPYEEGKLKVDHLDLSDFDGLEKELSKGDVAGVFVEGIQGVGGLDELNKSEWMKLRALTLKYHVLLIVDEIQSGMGRTGRFFAHSGLIKADMITMAKGLGNGLPVGAVIMQSKLAVSKGMLGSTFGGGPVVCAAAESVLNILEQESLMENARQLGAFLKDELKKIDGVNLVKGRGLMLGVVTDFPAKLLQDKMMQLGVVVGLSSNPHVLRFLPPLTINKTECEHFLSKFRTTIKNLMPVKN